MKRKNLFVYSFTVILSMAFLSGCRIGQKTVDTTKTQITFCHFMGTGSQTKWYEGAKERFTELTKDVSYEEGKLGVEIQVSEDINVPNDNRIHTSGYDIMLLEDDAKIYENAEGGFLLDLSEIVQTIDPTGTKIDKDCLKRMVGPDGKYYGLPHYSWYSGPTYDVELFTKKDLYFAAPEETEAEEACSKAQDFYDPKTESFKFVIDYAKYPNQVKRSTGPDGVYGTEDDGLPSSIQELCILCEQIKYKGYDPFIMAGNASVISFYLVDALWASLAGKGKMNNIYCNWTDTPIDVVTDVSTTEELFYQGSGIYAPVIGQKNVVLTDDNGYLVYQMPERYYALAFLELIIKRGWFSEENLKSGTSSFAAQKNFVNGTVLSDETRKQGGILYDASYWYHEAAEHDAFKQYEEEHEGKKRDIAYMPLPTLLKGSITPRSKGSEVKQTLLNLGSTYLYCRSDLNDMPGRKQAVLDFVKFIYSDAELAKFSETSGLTIPIKYDYDMTKLSKYHERLGNLVKNDDVVEFASNSLRFNRNISTFTLYYDSPLNNVKIGAKNYSGVGYRDIISLNKETAYAIFSAGFTSKGAWDNMSRS